MQNIYEEVNTLDKKCYEKYHLSEDILMEHAALSMYNFIENNFSTNIRILIVSGAGNNGADGIALARLLHKKYKVTLYTPFGAKSDMAKIQLKRCKALKVKIVSNIYKADVIVDCLFGSGLNRELDKDSLSLIKKLNRLDAYKLACDIPSGINNQGQISKYTFKANTTITMGALKLSLLSDFAKEYVGKIEVANLGIQRELYESKTNYFLLNETDLNPPYRKNKSTHKGTFGHFAVALGEKQGAGMLCADAGFAFGCGLITVVSDKTIKKIPNYIMSNESLPANTTAIAIGMGLGKTYDKKLLQNNIAKVVDADLFYDKIILEVLKQKNVVLTPHPKEFCALLKLTRVANIDITELQNNRITYVEKFSKKYPHITLLLKGANVIISQNKKIYINNLGTSVLSKGGSGDVLCGLIGSLLSQGYKPLDATINASLAHTIASNKYKGSNYSMTPADLIQEIKTL